MNEKAQILIVDDESFYLDLLLELLLPTYSVSVAKKWSASHQAGKLKKHTDANSAGYHDARHEWL